MPPAAGAAAAAGVVGAAAAPPAVAGVGVLVELWDRIHGQSASDGMTLCQQQEAPKSHRLTSVQPPTAWHAPDEAHGRCLCLHARRRGDADCWLSTIQTSVQLWRTPLRTIALNSSLILQYLSLVYQTLIRCRDIALAGQLFLELNDRRPTIVNLNFDLLPA